MTLASLWSAQHHIRLCLITVSSHCAGHRRRLSFLLQCTFTLLSPADWQWIARIKDFISFHVVHVSVEHLTLTGVKLQTLMGPDRHITQHTASNATKQINEAYIYRTNTNQTWTDKVLMLGCLLATASSSRSTLLDLPRREVSRQWTRHEHSTHAARETQVIDLSETTPTYAAM